MAGLFDDDRVPGSPDVRCIDCTKFGGLARDRTEWLFKMGKGYCNDDRHPGGKYNVVQSITGIKKCPLFEPAEPDVVRKLESRLAELRLAGVSNPAVPVK